MKEIVEENSNDGEQYHAALLCGRIPDSCNNA